MSRAPTNGPGDEPAKRFLLLTKLLLVLGPFTVTVYIVSYLSYKDLYGSELKKEYIR